MLRFEPVLQQEKPDLVLVVGDVNSTLACSLVAAKLHIPIAHVEAGLRSFDTTMPEEINRIVTDVLSDFCFTPSRIAGENLIKGGIAQEKIFFVGNVMVDSLLGAMEIARRRQTWKRWGLTPRDYAVVTLHRASNVDDIANLSDLIETLIAAANRLPLVFPIHPRTLQQLDLTLVKYWLCEMHPILSLPSRSVTSIFCASWETPAWRSPIQAASRRRPPCSVSLV